MKFFWLLSVSLLVGGQLFAHTIDFEVNKKSSEVIFTDYVQYGFQHIIPLGLDHILFIVCVFFLNNSLWSIIKQASLFTLAHSITLFLAMNDMISISSSIIEPLIALSIAILAIENILKKSQSAMRHFMVFGFGLLHGLGFAGALSELGFPTYYFGTALVAFNIGVELGQLSIVFALYIMLHLILSNKSFYRNRIVIPINIVIALIGIYWTITRTLNF